MTNVPDDARLAGDADVLRPFERDGWLDEMRAAESPRRPGRLGAYEIHDEVRGGGQGLVFRATHGPTGRLVALKRLAAGTFSTDEERRRFEREIDTAMALSHPGIVTVYGAERVDDVELLVMEWVDGRPISEWSANLAPGRTAEETRLRAFLQVCDAVQHAHQRGVIHRDLKPGNVLVDADGRCRVLDFGLARRLPNGAPADATVATLTQGFVGTPAYAAPEHFTAGAAPLDVRSDVYSLGVILYELVSGRRPFAAESLRELIDQITERTPPRLGNRELDAVLSTAMAKDPARRYATVHAFANDVRRLLERRPVTAVPPSAAYLLRTWVRRHRAVAALAAALLVVLALVAVFGYRQAARIETERQRAAHEARRARTIADFYLDVLVAIGPGQQSESTEVLDAFLAAARGAREFFHEFPDAAVEVEANLACMMLKRGRLAECRELATGALELQRRLQGPATLTALLLRTLGDERLASARVDEAMSLLQMALDTYRNQREELPRQYTAALWSLANALLLSGRDDEAVVHLQEVERIASRIGDVERSMGAQVSLAGIACRSGHAAEALPELARLFADAQRNGVTRDTLHHVALTYGDAVWDTGDSAGSIEPYRCALEAWEKVLEPGHPNLAGTEYRLARAHLNVGHAREACDLYCRAIEHGLDAENTMWANYGRADAAFRLRRFEDAADWIEAAFAAMPDEVVASFYGAHGRALQIGALIQAGALDRARETLPKLRDAVQRHVAQAPLPDWVQTRVDQIEAFFAAK